MVENKTRALITGACSGIGTETALAFASLRIDVGLITYSVDRLASIKDAVTKRLLKAKTYIVDLAKVSEIEEKMRQGCPSNGP